MKFSILYLIFLLTTNIVFGAENNSDSLIFVTKYYPLINKAELSIVNEDYKQALENYKVAFTVVEKRKPFARDLFNAAVCGSKLNDSLFIYSCLTNLVSKGATIDYLTKSTSFKDFFQTTLGMSVMKEYPAQRELLLNSINLEVKNELNTLFETDQYFRRKPDNYTVYGDTITKIDDYNINRLIEIIDKYGFPDETLIGIDDSLSVMPLFCTVIWHQSSYKNYEVKQKLIQILKKASCEGKIDPHVFGRLTGHFSGLDSYFTMPFFKVMCRDNSECEKDEELKDKVGKWVYRELPPEKENLINQKRFRVGLETVDEYREKVFYAKGDNDFYFKFLGGLTTYNGCSVKTAKSFLSTAKLMD